MMPTSLDADAEFDGRIAAPGLHVVLGPGANAYAKRLLVFYESRCLRRAQIVHPLFLPDEPSVEFVDRVIALAQAEDLTVIMPALSAQNIEGLWHAAQNATFVTYAPIDDEAILIAHAAMWKLPL